MSEHADRRQKVPRVARGLALSVVAVVASGGCSLLLVDGPSSNYEWTREVHCTTGNGWPIFDVVLSGLEAARVVYAATAPNSTYQAAQLSRGADIGLGVGLMALTAVSAGVGFDKTSRCREAADELRLDYDEVSGNQKRRHGPDPDATTSASPRMRGPAPPAVRPAPPPARPPALPDTAGSEKM